jgi:hypothetical protein
MNFLDWHVLGNPEMRYRSLLIKDQDKVIVPSEWLSLVNTFPLDACEIDRAYAIHNDRYESEKKAFCKRHLSTYPPIHLSAYPPILLSSYPPILLSTYPPILVSNYPSTSSIFFFNVLLYRLLAQFSNYYIHLKDRWRSDPAIFKRNDWMDKDWREWRKWVLDELHDYADLQQWNKVR